MSNVLLATPGLSTFRHLTTLLRTIVSDAPNASIHITNHYGLTGRLDMSSGINSGYWENIRLQITFKVRRIIFLIMVRKYASISLSYYNSKECFEEIERFLQHIPETISINELLKFEFRGVQFGRELLSSIQRYSFSNTSQEYSFTKTSIERKLLKNSLEIIYCYEQLLKTNDFDVMYVNEVSYVNWGIPIKCALKSNIEVIHVSYGYLGNQYYYKSRYRSITDVYIPSGFEASKCDNPLQLTSKSSVKPVKKIGVWTHLCWDSAGVYGDQLYKSYNDWLRAVYRISLERKDLLWIFKIHPHELSAENNPRKELTNQLNNTATFLREMISPFDEHIIVDYSGDTHLDDIDAFTTVTGTIRYEAAAQGKSVVLAERSGKLSGGFSFYCDTQGQYLDYLRKIDCLVVGAKEIELAEDYRKKYYDEKRYFHVTNSQIRADLINLLFGGFIK